MEIQFVNISDTGVCSDVHVVPIKELRMIFSSYFLFKKKTAESHE